MKHCATSDACIQTFDHYSVWISNAVGENNHRSFFLFLMLGFLLSGLGIVLSLVCLVGTFSEIAEVAAPVWAAVGLGGGPEGFRGGTSGAKARKEVVGGGEGVVEKEGEFGERLGVGDAVGQAVGAGIA